MKKEQFEEAWREMESIEPLTPPNWSTDVINPTGQKSLEECQDLDRESIHRRLEFYNEEISVLENRVKPQDTGHIKTTIRVMKARKEEILHRLQGHPDWFDEYLSGGKS